MKAPKVVLASSSPRRQQFFQNLGIRFDVESSDIDESPAPNESPTELVARLALAKAMTVAGRLAQKTAQSDAVASDELLVVGADTVVAVDGELLGKPASVDEARTMLRRLRARPHQVHTALAAVSVSCGELKRKRTRTNSTTVIMRAYDNDEIAAYLATGDHMDKAGAYAIQHPQFRPVQTLTGCPAGVMGLPVADLLCLLAESNVSVELSPLQICPALTGLQCCRQQSENTHCIRQ